MSDDPQLPTETTESTILDLTRGIPTQDPAEAMQVVDRRVAFFRGIRERTLGLLYPGDFQDMGGKPYLQAIGAERLAPLWGIYWEELQVEPSLDETRRRLRLGEHVTVEVRGFAGSRVTGERGQFLGGRSSDDPFYADRTGGIAQVDPEDLRKAAVSNFEVQAITRLLGLRGLNWPDLEKYGLTPAGAGRVTFATGGDTTGQDRRRTLVAELQKLLIMQHGDTPAALDALWRASMFRNEQGKDVGLRTWADAQKASDKWLQRTIERVRKEPFPFPDKAPPTPTTPAKP